MVCAAYLLLTATRNNKELKLEAELSECDTAGGPGAADREGEKVEEHFIDLSLSERCHYINGSHKATLTSCSFQLSVT